VQRLVGERESFPLYSHPGLAHALPVFFPAVLYVHVLCISFAVSRPMGGSAKDRHSTERFATMKRKAGARHRHANWVNYMFTVNDLRSYIKSNLPAGELNKRSNIGNRSQRSSIHLKAEGRSGLPKDRTIRICFPLIM
jgi:hypothetical protein